MNILLLIYRDVNGTDRVQVVAPLYHTRWINIHFVLVCSVRIFVMRIPTFFLISMDIHGYPRVFTKRKF